eukprot:1203294-Pleurochrysis_carterae.AAC.4
MALKINLSRNSMNLAALELVCELKRLGYPMQQFALQLCASRKGCASRNLTLLMRQAEYLKLNSSVTKLDLHNNEMEQKARHGQSRYARAIEYGHQRESYVLMLVADFAYFKLQYYRRSEYEQTIAVLHAYRSTSKPRSGDRTHSPEKLRGRALRMMFSLVRLNISAAMASVVKWPRRLGEGAMLESSRSVMC